MFSNYCTYLKMFMEWKYAKLDICDCRYHKKEVPQDLLLFERD